DHGGHQREADVKRAFDLKRAAGGLFRGGLDLRRETAEVDKGERIERAREKQNQNNDEAKKLSHGSQAPPAAAPMACPLPVQSASAAGASSAKSESTRCAPADRSRWGS